MPIHPDVRIGHVHFRDPDENGVELYWDRPKELWPRTPDGQLTMFTRRLDVAALLREAHAGVAPGEPVGPGPRDLA